MKRGQIAWINLEDTLSPEMGKTRPGIIVSNDEHNVVFNTVVVIPLSTRTPEIWPLRIGVPQVAGLQQRYAIVPGIRQISKARIANVVGRLSDNFMQQLESAYSAYLGE